MQIYKAVHLYLDRDTTGQKCIQKALEIDKQKFIDESHLYKNYKDLNDYIMHIGQTQKQSLAEAMSLFSSSVASEAPIQQY